MSGARTPHTGDLSRIYSARHLSSTPSISNKNRHIFEHSASLHTQNDHYMVRCPPFVYPRIWNSRAKERLYYVPYARSLVAVDGP
jgi:hypothetical protein